MTSISVACLPILSALFALPFFQDDADEPERTAQKAPDEATRKLFDYDREADLDVREVGVQQAGDFTRMDLTYASPMGGRVPALLFEPVGEGPHAGLLLMHGMPGKRENMEDLAQRYVRTGAVVLCISAPWARPDGPRDDVVTFTEEDRDEQIQLIQDLRRGVDLLESFPWVDRERIGYVGGSYGGAMGGLLAGVERRIKAYVLMVGDGGLVAHFTGPDDGEGPPEGTTAEAWKQWLAWMEPIEPIRFVSEAAPSELLFQNGRADRLVPAADAKVYQEAGSEPKTVIWYDTGHAITPELLRDQVKWLAKRIGIDGKRFGGI